MLPPTAAETYNYILTRRANITIALLAVIDNIAQIVYYFVFLYVLNKMKGVALWKCFIVAGIANAIAYLLQLPFFFSEQLSIYLILTCRFLYSLVFNLAVDLLLMPMVGRVSKYLPEGFESTGVVVVISGVNFFSTLQNQFGADQIMNYKIGNGYYDRAIPVYKLNFAIMVSLFASAPLFLSWG
jgi:hypothetical protein